MTTSLQTTDNETSVATSSKKALAKETKAQMKKVLHRVVTLMEEHPNLFQGEWGTTHKDNTAIAQLATWASQHTHYTIEQMHIKLSKYAEEAKELVRKGEKQGPLPKGSPAKQIMDTISLAATGQTTPKRPNTPHVTSTKTPPTIRRLCRHQPS